MLRLTLAVALQGSLPDPGQGQRSDPGPFAGPLLFVFSLPGYRRAHEPAGRRRRVLAEFGLRQVLIFNQLYALEEANNARLGLLLCPAPIQGVWLGKAAAGLTLLLLAQVIFLPASVIFLGQELGGPPLPGLAALLLVDLGMCALGSCGGSGPGAGGARIP